MNKNKIIYWVSTGILTAIMLMSAVMYLLNNQEIQGAFTSLGFPVWIIYPLAIAKLLGLIAIWTKKSLLLKEWAYAGFFFNTVLALSAHLTVGDGQFMGAIIALSMVIISRIFDSKF